MQTKQFIIGSWPISSLELHAENTTFWLFQLSLQYGYSNSQLCSLLWFFFVLSGANWHDHRISSIDSTVWALFWHLIKKVLILKNFFMAMSLLNVGFISLDCFLCMLSLYWCEGILLSCSLIRNSFSFSSSSVCIHVLLKSIVLLCVKPAAFLLA